MNMADIRIIWLLLTAIITQVPWGSCLSASEDRLATFLLDPSRYSSDVRPVRKYEDKLIVRHGLTLAQLIKLDEKNQIITTRVVLIMRWNDFMLTWNPSDYDGITEINVDISLIWMPQVQLLNNADESLDTIAVPRAVIRFNGTVTALLPRILKSTCAINVKDFPFDKQKCELKFGSFQFDTEQMEVLPLSDSVKSPLGIARYHENGEWDLIDEKVIQRTVYHAFSNNTVFSELAYTLWLRRRPLYYIANFIIPCVLIALVTILLFLIPPDTGEQMAVGVTILLSMAVFFLLLEDKMPETSDVVPLLGKYFACSILQISLAVGATCMMLCFHHHDATEVPTWMKKYILIKLAWLLRMKTSENDVMIVGRRNTVIQRLRKSTRTGRRTDKFATEIGRNHLLIWQAKAKAKRLRRERAEKEKIEKENMMMNNGSEKTMEDNVKVVDFNRQLKKGRLSLVATVTEVEKKKMLGERQKKESGNEVIASDTKLNNELVKENAKEPTVKEEFLGNEKQEKEDRKNGDIINGESEEHDEKEGCKETGKVKGVNAQAKKNTLIVKGKKRKSFSEEEPELIQQMKKGGEVNKDESDIEEITNLESQKENMENYDKEGQRISEERKSIVEKKERIENETLVKQVGNENVRRRKGKSQKEEHERKVEGKKDSEAGNDVEASDVTKNRKEEDHKGRKVFKESKKIRGEKKKHENLQENDINAVATESRRRRLPQPNEKDEKETSRNRKENKENEGIRKENEKKVISMSGNDEDVESLKSEGEEEKESQKQRKDTAAKAGTWVKLGSKDERKKSKHKKEDSALQEEEKAIAKKINAQPRRKSDRKMEKRNSDPQNLKIYDIEDPVVVVDQEEEKDETLDDDTKGMVPNTQLTLVERFSNTQNPDDAAGSTSSILTCDDDTRILIQPAKTSKATKRPAAKQLKVVDHVLRIKESLSQRLHSSKTANKLEQTSPPQPTALQLSAKKIENASNWAEAEHESVKLMAHKIQETESADQLRGKWKEVGRVLNNLLMWMYIVSIVLAFFIFFGPILAGGD